MDDLSASNPVDDDGLDAELMAFAARRRREREAREEALESAGASAPVGRAGDLEFVEVVDEPSAASMPACELENVVVMEFDPTRPHRLGDVLPTGTGAEMPDEEGSYAIKRVAELRMIAAATPNLDPNEDTARSAEEARKINLDALEEGKKTGAKAPAKKPAPEAAKKATKQVT